MTSTNNDAKKLICQEMSYGKNIVRCKGCECASWQWIDTAMTEVLKDEPYGQCGKSPSGYETTIYPKLPKLTPKIIKGWKTSTTQKALSKQQPSRANPPI